MTARLRAATTGPLLAIAAVAYLYLLGRLKLYYYFATFGIDSGSLELSTGDFLFESWFPAQQLLFAGLMGWVALRCRSLWISAAAALYALLPIASHYAFLAPADSGWDWLIRYRHTLLKFVPLVAVLCLALVPRYRRALFEADRRLAPALRAIGWILLLSWGISTAKHSGAYDANRILRDPDLLPTVRIDGGTEHYLLHATDGRWIVWDGSPPDAEGRLETLELPRDDAQRVERVKRFSVQPGGQLL